MIADSGSIYDPDDVPERTVAASPPKPVPEGVAEPAHEVDGPTLVVTRGPTAGNRFPLDKDTITIGRGKDCDIVFDNVTVSRQHAEIRRDREQIVIADSGSLNSTYVNRTPVSEAVLAHGDEVWIGTFRLVFFAGR